MGGSTLTSAQKVLRVLKQLQRTPSLSVTEVAELVHVSPSSAHRILATLVAEGLVRQQDDGRRYEAGHSLLDLALSALTNVSLRSIAHRHLQAISDRVPAQVWLIHVDLPRVLTWDLCHSNGQPLATPDLVSSRPLHSMASGKVLLSALNSRDLNRAYPQEKLPACTPRTISSKQRLVTELSLIRKFGYAVQIDESLDGISAIAVPVLSLEKQVVSALAITGPTSDYTRPVVRERIELALQAAGRIEADLHAATAAGASSRAG